MSYAPAERGGKVDDNLAESLHELDGVVDESGSQLGNEGLHLGSLRVK